MRDDLRAAANLIDAFAAEITEWPDDDLGGHALAYAHNGWPVLPLRGKVPRTEHGATDATCDLNMVAGWWLRWPDANIGARIPAGVVVLDIDPRNGGEPTWRELHRDHAEVQTRTAVSGRGDGGRHLYYAHPGGKLARLGDGVDLKVAGYVVAPPSRHPDTGNPYLWVDTAAPLVPLPAHLIRRPETRHGTRTPHDPDTPGRGDSVADWFTTTTTWPAILEPHGWHVVRGDGDSDGSWWRHPGATNASSASIRHGCLFVYSPNTPMAPTDVDAPAGYTRFRAWAILEHRGDLSAAARAARARRDGGPTW